jgi:pyruvate dehydrogenase E1 component alpha subunit
MNGEVKTSMTSKAKMQSAAANSGFSLISDEKLLALYASLLKCRLLEERVSALCQQGRLPCAIHATYGQEAVAVGLVSDLLDEDTIGPLQGDFIAGFLKGMPLDALFGELHDRVAEEGQNASAPGHLSSAPLNVINPLFPTEAQLNIATGVALANKVKGRGNVVVAFSGAEAAAQDFWLEAMHFAGSQGLPIVFACQNGLGAGPANTQTKVDLALQTAAYGFPCMTVDGNDVVAVYRVAAEAINHARMGHGPTLIECVPNRLPGEPEMELGETDDPIRSMEAYLAGKGLFRAEFKHQVDAMFGKKLDAAVKLLNSY